MWGGGGETDDLTLCDEMPVLSVEEFDLPFRDETDVERQDARENPGSAPGARTGSR